MYISTIAFPRMHKEREEKRDFLPSLFGKIERITDKKIFVEEGYGKDMGFTRQDYLKENPNITFLNSLDELYSKDLVIVVRSPGESTISGMEKELSCFPCFITRQDLFAIELSKKQGFFPSLWTGSLTMKAKGFSFTMKELQTLLLRSLLRN